MPLRRKTLRRMSPVTRDGFKLLADVESLERRLRNYLQRVQDLEGDARAFRAKRNANRTYRPAASEHEPNMTPIEDAVEGDW